MSDDIDNLTPEEGRERLSDYLLGGLSETDQREAFITETLAKMSREELMAVHNAAMHGNFASLDRTFVRDCIMTRLVAEIIRRTRQALDEDAPE